MNGKALLDASLLMNWKDDSLIQKLYRILQNNPFYVSARQTPVKKNH